jgi:hypothetical protein
MAAHHPALRVHANAVWRDVHFANDQVRCTRYEIVPTAPSTNDHLAEVGGALRAVLEETFRSAEPLRVGGGRWSLSTIAKPTGALLDLANYRRLGAVPPSWLTPSYLRASQTVGTSPMLIAAGMSINAVNRELARRNLALKTSGASDGQSFAGAMATGTHGADMRVGALHDTVIGIHIVNSPTTSVLLEPAGGGLTDRAAQTLATWFGIPCQRFSNDELFRAAQVHLGSLGVVLNVIVETVPLYALIRHSSPHREGDARWRAVLADREPGNADPSHPADPDCLSLILNPYGPEPSDDPRAWVMSMQKRAYQGQPGVITTPTDVSLKSDLADFLPALVHVYEADIELPDNPLLRAITSSQLRSIYGATSRTTSALPAAMFGPPDFLGIDFDPLRGASAEYVFDATQAGAAVQTILDTLAAQADARNQYLGGIGVRFVRGSNAWLAPNAKPMNCFIELQSLYTDELPAIHTAIATALQQSGIAYCGHWGQWAMNTPGVLQRWWPAPAVAAWKAARAALLPTPAARAIFASPILSGAGLD